MASEIIIPILLTIIAYWLKRFIDRSDKRFDYFTFKIEELTKGLTQLFEDYKNQNINCQEKHKDIKATLINHERRISKLEK